mgnify:CR=1 FL=1
MNVAAKYGKNIGIHAHNNQQLAFANTIEAVKNGVSLLDGTVSGMGRGAGNCYMESLLGFLKNPKYSIYSLLRFIENYMIIPNTSLFFNQKQSQKGSFWDFVTN